MRLSFDVLRNDELASYELRNLYKTFGYSQYKVGRFEEYDLYAHNKSFLVSENILTFTDTDGKLMALKPDITLSIVKNIPCEKENIHKLYYNENVYRTAPDSHGFKEIMQTGLECIGNIDMYSEAEVIMLAQRSLEVISEDNVLDISHMGFLDGLLDLARIDDVSRESMFALVKSKNTFELENLCNKISIDKKISLGLCELAQLYCPLGSALPILKSLVANKKMQLAFDELQNLSDMMNLYGNKQKLFFDLSVVNDRNYYDGIIFTGFVKGIADSVLSGGRYDKLLERMGKQLSAIGFAVYLDRLERLNDSQVKDDVDVMLIYDNTASAKDIIEAVKKLEAEGKSIKVSPVLDQNCRYRQLLKITNEGDSVLEANG